ncbi:MAG: cyaB [Planctomycetaceae bacterium]|nr:cyaB [Planctomycetaceae bacterium]
MQYEVELKFELADPAEVLRQLSSLQATRKADQSQVDQYFAHPVRDFAVTDEALRIRSIQDENRLTYKGPVVDKATKTRHESELEFASGRAAAEQLAAIWEHLGFRRVRVVRKQRQTYHLSYQDRDLEVCLDQVEGLGAFLEIETLADAENKSAAQRAILSLASVFKLSDPETRSYLEMLLERDQAETP